MASQKEIENGIKVFEMLTELGDFDTEQKTDDIFLVTEPDTGLEVIIDVEETTIIFLMDICPAERVSQEFGELLLKLNADEAVHGGFGWDTSKGKIIFKDVLEIANLDSNELQASIVSMVLTVSQNIKKISEIGG